MGKLLQYLLILSVPLLLVTGVNIVIDSKSFFSSRFADDLAEEIYDHPTSIYTEPEFRLVIKRLIELNKERHFNKIVLGSSRAMQIGTPIGETVLNVSVSGAVLEDYEILIKLLRENKITFDTITISAHGWLFNKNHGDTRYNVYNKLFSLDSIKKAFSWEYFINNISQDKYQLWNGNDKDFVVYPDGSIRYDIKYRTQVPDVENHVKQALEWPFANYLEIDEGHKNRFLKLITEIQDNTIIELVLLPYHPSVYPELIEKIPVIVNVEKFYNSLKSFNINVIGSYDPDILSLDDKYFYDPNHLNEAGLRLLYNSER
jgi:hypothetical protein